MVRFKHCEKLQQWNLLVRFKYCGTLNYNVKAFWQCPLDPQGFMYLYFSRYKCKADRISSNMISTIQHSLFHAKIIISLHFETLWYIIKFFCFTLNIYITRYGNKPKLISGIYFVNVTITTSMFIVDHIKYDKWYRKRKKSFGQRTKYQS